MREEIFGPVVAIATFKTIEEAIEIANDSEYGLAGGVYTTNLDTAIKVSNELQAGTIWVNSYDLFDQSTPFGGYKQVKSQSIIQETKTFQFTCLILT